jgi:fatty acyl-CoA reductase
MKLLTPKIIQLRPKTYTYTKAVAECLVIEAEKDIPFAIVRPSIVGASWREPFPGWIDNYNGPTALFVACGKGMLRTMLGNKSAIADIVPVDIPVNLMISTAWFRGTNRTKETIVYNCSTGQINCLRWGMVEKILNTCVIKNPYENIFLAPAASFTVSKVRKHVGIFFAQLFPSYLMDIYLRLANKKPM